MFQDSTFNIFFNKTKTNIIEEKSLYYVWILHSKFSIVILLKKLIKFDENKCIRNLVGIKFMLRMNNNIKHFMSYHIYIYVCVWVYVFFILNRIFQMSIFFYKKIQKLLFIENASLNK